jgi:hypothetical protein
MFFADFLVVLQRKVIKVEIPVGSHGHSLVFIEIGYDIAAETRFSYALNAGVLTMSVKVRRPAACSVERLESFTLKKIRADHVYRYRIVTTVYRLGMRRQVYNDDTLSPKNAELPFLEILIFVVTMGLNAEINPKKWLV